jgi:hypothetical protein
VVAHTYSHSTQETEAGGSQVQGQPGLHSESLSQATTKILKETLKTFLILKESLCIDLVPQKHKEELFQTADAPSLVRHTIKIQDTAK